MSLDKELKFDKAKDFVNLNNPIAEIDSNKAISIIKNMIDIYYKEETSKKNKNEMMKAPEEFFNILYSRLTSNYSDLNRFYYTLSGYESWIKKVFFIRNEYYEDFLIKNSLLEKLNNYINSIGKEIESLTDKFVNCKDINIINSYIGSITHLIQDNDYLNKLINSLESCIQTNKDDVFISKLILTTAIVSKNRRISCEEILMNSKDNESILQYANIFGLSNDVVTNACLSICDSHCDYKRLNDHMRNNGTILGGISNNPIIESSFLKNTKYNNFYSALEAYLHSILRNPENDLFLNCFVAVEQNNPANLNRIYNLYRKTYKHRVSRFNSEFESKLLDNLNVDNFIDYVISNSIFNDEIDNRLINGFMINIDYVAKYIFASKRTNPVFYKHMSESIHCLKYACHFNIRVPEGEDYIFSNASLTYKDSEEKIHEIIKYIGIVNSIEMSVCSLKIYEDYMIKTANRDKQYYAVILSYISFSKNKFIKFENLLCNDINFATKRCIELYNVNGLCTNSVVSFIEYYINYCKIVGKSGVNKINNVIFSKDVPTHPAIKKKLVEYILECAKMPCELFDNSIVGNEPEYLKFKEEYEKQATTRVKRQRRKLVGTDSQGQSQSGQGNEVSAGEITNVQ